VLAAVKLPARNDPPELKSKFGISAVRIKSLAEPRNAFSIAFGAMCFGDDGRTSARHLVGQQYRSIILLTSKA
jgi:hypothetical protein